MTNPHQMGARELALRLAQRELSALEVIEDCLARIEARDGEIHAWAALDPEFARRQARALDAGAVRGMLHGVPLGVKDIFDTAELPTEYGSPYSGHRPAWDAACVAAAVAARMVPLAYGTQTVGSIIRPAAYCGVVGYKPAYGMLSRSGMKLGAETLDTAGVIARSVEDAAAFEKAVQKLDAMGATMVDAELPDSFRELDASAQRILYYEMARGLAHEAAHHRSRVSPILLERIDAGARIAYREYALAVQYAADCRRRLAEHARDLDAILTPSATGEAPAGLGSTGDTAMNRLWTLLHGPCITVPAGEGPAGLPLGVQLIGVPSGNHVDRADAHLLAVARWVESILKNGDSHH